MGMEQYLNELLYRYNCVVIPDFGAFLTQRKSAYVHQATHTFYPPRKLVSFNEQFKSNDGLLVSYMADAEQSGYETMLSQVGQTVQEWKKKLQKGERISFLNIGELWVNKEGKIQFQPSEQINFLTASYGLSSFVAAPVDPGSLKGASGRIGIGSAACLYSRATTSHPFKAIPQICRHLFIGLIRWPHRLQDLSTRGLQSTFGR